GKTIRPHRSRTRSLALGDTGADHQPNRRTAHDQSTDSRFPLAFDLQQAFGHLACGRDSFGHRTSADLTSSLLLAIGAISVFSRRSLPSRSCFPSGKIGSPITYSPDVLSLPNSYTLSMISCDRRRVGKLVRGLNRPTTTH